MNIELLQQIKAVILADPDAFRMDTWSCGTAHCIAGWALVLNGLKIANHDDHAVNQLLEDGRKPQDVAAELLALECDPEAWEVNSDRLFNVTGWPDKFEESYYDAKERTERARIAADRIDHFIATNGAE